MTLNADTVRHVSRLRADLDRLTDHLTRELTAAWVAEWDRVLFDVAAAITELSKLRDDRWPTRAQVARSEQTQRALAAAGAALTRLADRTRRAGEAAVLGASGLAVAAQGQMIASQLPPLGAEAFRPNPPDPEQVEKAHEQHRRNLSKYLAPLAGAAAARMRRRLERGAPSTQGRRDGAHQVLTDAEAAFNAGLTRALTVTHTELADAARAAAMLTQLANSDVLVGWTWLSRRDRRTCPACWAQDGTTYPIDQPGPWDHQRGRCIRVPETKSWRELGFPGIPETSAVLASAEDAFRDMSRADQLAVMGAARLELLDRGDIVWADLARLQQNPTWRPSYVMTPVRDLAA